MDLREKEMGRVRVWLNIQYPTRNGQCSSERPPGRRPGLQEIPIRVDPSRPLESRDPWLDIGISISARGGPGWNPQGLAGN